MTRIKTLLLPATVLLLAAALSACGGSGDANEHAASAPAATATPKPADGGAPKTSGAQKSSASQAVAIKNFAFGPANVTVKAGQKITWTNADDAPHTVTGGGIDSGALAKGASFAFTADKAGTIAYICSIHPSMKGTITVQ